MANNQLREEVILWTKQFDGKIDDIFKQLKKLEKQGKNLGGGFDGSFSSMSSGLKQITSLAGKAGAALGAIGVGVNLAQWFSDSMAKAKELSMEAEGVKLAFDRLNKPNLLDNLNRATHNTISNLELMKQAVKFKDFNLNIEQMGTYLAFAQQKAKDTGESIDYLVNSITTGLGRQSLQILDNLGLSAAEIKNEMKKGGDMTTAVANIIKKRMEEAGDYVETAADRAARKEKELNDALVEMGNAFTAGQSAAGDFFHAIELGSIKALTWVGKLLDGLTEAGRTLKLYEQYGGDNKVSAMIAQLGNGKGNKANDTYNRQMAEFARQEKKYQDRIDKNPYNQAAREQLQAVRMMKTQYNNRAQAKFLGANKPTKTTTDTKGKKNKVYPEGSVGWLDQQISKLKEKVKVSVDITEIRKLNQEIADLTRKRDNLEAGWTPKNISLSDMNLGKMSFTQAPKAITPKDIPSTPMNTGTIYDQYNRFGERISAVLDTLDMGLIGREKAQELIDGINSEVTSLGLKPIDVSVKAQGLGKAQDAVEGMAAAFQSLGDVAEEPAFNVMGTIGQAIANVALGYSQATTQAATMGPWAWIAFAAAGLAQMLAVIASIKSATEGYANGGIIGGSSFAGDNLIARVNSGEMILNSSQQRNLFHLLDNGGAIGGGGQVEFKIKGSDLYGSLKNYSNVKGRSGLNTGIK